MTSRAEILAALAAAQNDLAAVALRVGQYPGVDQPSRRYADKMVKNAETRVATLQAQLERMDKR